jgi:hypothetical protein
MSAWDLLVDRADLSSTRIQPAPAADEVELGPNQVLLEVERFALTANNITYGVVGDSLGYWSFFPAPGGWGRIPAWGFARAVRSNSSEIAAGVRLYGYLPMSTHMVAEFSPGSGGFMEVSPHRAGLAAAYNRYEISEPSAGDDHKALLRPLFATAYLLDDYLAEIAPDATVLLSSASSKTALGLAWLLAGRGRKAVALTSQRNEAFTAGTRLYRDTVRYESVAALDVEGRAVFVDFAGDPAVRAAVHQRVPEQLVHSAIVGATHWEDRAGAAGTLPGPQPAFFFAPHQMAKRAAEIGGAELAKRIAAALAGFVGGSSWLRVERHRGPEALSELYASLLHGPIEPEVGHVVFPGD